MGIFQRYPENLLLGGDAKFSGIVLRDVAVLPDVKVILLGQVHGLLICGNQFSQSSASFLVGHQEPVGDEGLADIVGGVVWFDEGDKGLAADAVLYVELELTIEQVLLHCLDSLGCVVFLKSVK